MLLCSEGAPPDDVRYDLLVSRTGEYSGASSKLQRLTSNTGVDGADGLQWFGDGLLCKIGDLTTGSGGRAAGAGALACSRCSVRRLSASIFASLAVTSSLSIGDAIKKPSTLTFARSFYLFSPLTLTHSGLQDTAP